jgi:hypothetical protein
MLAGILLRLRRKTSQQLQSLRLKLPRKCH